MGPLKILLLEDIREDAELVLRQLKRDFKFKYECVDNEADFRSTLTSQEPDIILSDYNLPQFDAMQALAIRNSQALNTPFIIVTGSINELTAVECIKAGANDYVTKEHLERLNIAVKNALEQKKTLEEKELAQKELVASLERFQRFVENDISGDYIEDETHVTYCNKRILEIFDFPDLDALNAFGTENLHQDPEDRKKLIDAIKNQRVVKDYEIAMHTSKGKLLTLVENAMGEFDQAGNLIGIQGYIIDITQRKKAEEELRQSEKLFKDLTLNMASGVIIYNEEGFLYVNPATTKITEYSAKEMLQMSFWDVVHPDHKELVKTRGLLRLQKKGVSTNYLFKLVTKSGKIKWINYTAGLIEFKGKQAAIGTVFDVTREKEAEFEVRKLSTVVEQNPLAILITDTNGIIEYANQAFLNESGYTPQEVFGQNPRFLQSGKTPKETFPELWDTISSGKVWTGEFVNQKKNGEDYIEYAVVSPITDEHDNILRYVSMGENITKRKQMEMELISAKEVAEEANRLKSAFLANMSHELRTPLNGILGFSELMMDVETVEETHEMTHFIYESGQRLLRTLKLILDISRLEAGSFQAQLTALDILQKGKDVVELYKPDAEKKALQIRMHSDLETCILDADEKFINDILENIIDNAIKFTEEGSVTLSIKKAKVEELHYVVLEIKDTGIGISEEKQKIIFEDFRQESEGYGRTYEGTGLGLSLAKKCVVVMDGFIRLKSKIGLGSTFSVYIPESRKHLSNNKHLTINETKS